MIINCFPFGIVFTEKEKPVGNLSTSLPNVNNKLGEFFFLIFFCVFGFCFAVLVLRNKTLSL